MDTNEPLPPVLPATDYLYMAPRDPSRRWTSAAARLSGRRRWRRGFSAGRLPCLSRSWWTATEELVPGALRRLAMNELRMLSRGIAHLVPISQRSFLKMIELCNYACKCGQEGTTEFAKIRSGATLLAYWSFVTAGSLFSRCMYMYWIELPCR